MTTTQTDWLKVKTGAVRDELVARCEFLRSQLQQEPETALNVDLNRALADVIALLPLMRPGDGGDPAIDPQTGESYKVQFERTTAAYLELQRRFVDWMDGRPE